MLKEIESGSPNDTDPTLPKPRELPPDKATEPSMSEPPVVAQDFIKNPRTGGVDFGEITPDIGKVIRRQAGTVRLIKGNLDFGEIHIEGRHGDILRTLGYKSVGDFVADVAENYTQIYEGRKGRLILVKKNGRDRIAVIELKPGRDGSGDFWSATTAFAPRPKYLTSPGRKLLWDSGPPTAVVDSGDVGPSLPGRPEHENPGRVAPGGKSQSSSTSNIELSTGESKFKLPPAQEQPKLTPKQEKKLETLQEKLKMNESERAELDKKLEKTKADIHKKAIGERIEKTDQKKTELEKKIEKIKKAAGGGATEASGGFLMEKTTRMLS